MKAKRRVLTLLLALLLVVPGRVMTVEAADSVVFFSDLQTSVGEMFTVTGTAVMRDDQLGDVSIQVTYDTNYIQFMEGSEGVSLSGAGTVTYTATGQQTDRVEFQMTFQAIQEGSIRIEQGQTAISTSGGETAQVETGYADVTIGPGDPSKIVTPATPTGADRTITVNGAEYGLTGVFSDSELPVGFTAGEFTYEGASYKCAVQESSGLVAAYLIDSQQGGRFWLYDAEKNSFTPLEQIMISNDYYIVVLDGTDEVTMPEEFEEALIAINGTDFPVWIEPEREGFYILYAANSAGERSLYLYDSVEHTYQRRETPVASVVPETPEEAEGAKSKPQKILAAISDHLVWVLVGVGCLVVVLLVFLIVLAVKLFLRNKELDSLYDQYGAGMDKSGGVKAQAKPVVKAARLQDEDYDRVEDLDDDFHLSDEEFEEEEYGQTEKYDEPEDLSDIEEMLSAHSSRPRIREYDDYYDEEDEDDEDYDLSIPDEEDEYYDEDEEEDEESAPKKAKKADTFELDFVDLD